MKNYSVKYSFINNNEFKLIFGQKYRLYTIDEVSKHNTKNDAWVIVNNYILNVTNFIEDHPGGSDQFKNRLGTDVTSIWIEYHNNDIIDKWFPSLIIGYLK